MIPKIYKSEYANIKLVRIKHGNFKRNETIGLPKIYSKGLGAKSFNAWEKTFKDWKGLLGNTNEQNRQIWQRPLILNACLMPLHRKVFKERMFVI